MKTLSECTTPHEQIEYLCNRWIDLAKTYTENETPATIYTASGAR